MKRLFSSFLVLVCFVSSACAATPQYKALDYFDAKFNPSYYSHTYVAFSGLVNYSYPPEGNEQKALVCMDGDLSKPVMVVYNRSVSPEIQTNDIVDIWGVASPVVEELFNGDGSVFPIVNATAIKHSILNVE